MPQATNQRLVSQMAAAPTGRGTVYNALLQARAANRERAAIINTCERQRLVKVHRSIDKDLQHAEWQADQTINRIKGSLTKLLAYQKVLKEDFPARQLCSQASLRQLGENIDVRDSLIPDQTFKDADITPKRYKKDSGTLSTDTTDVENLHLRSINEVSAANKFRMPKSSGRRVTTSGFETFDRSLEDTNENPKTLVNSHGNSLEVNKQQNENESKNIKKVRSREDNKQCGSITVKEVQHSKLLPLRERLYEQSEQLVNEKLNAQTHRENFNRIEQRKENMNNNRRPQLLRRNQKMKEPVSKQPSRFHVFDTSEERLMRGPLTEAQKIWHDKRIKRKDTATQRILTRGFDMRTLAWEIDRKLVVMDPGYARQRERRQLVKEGREDVTRLVMRNQADCPTKVLTSNRAQPKTADLDERIGAAFTRQESSNADVTASRSLKEGQEDEDQERPVFETVTMLNPLLHKIPLSY